MASTLTEGFIGVTSLSLSTDLDFEGLLQRLLRRRYNGSVHEAGWGNVADDEAVLGRRLLNRPPGGDPVFLRDPRLGPARIEARLYFDRYDAGLAKQADGMIADQYLYTSDAMDVLFIAGVEGFDILASSASDTVIRRYLVPALLALRDDEVDANFTISVGRSQGPLDPDLQLWLIARYNGNRDLTSDITLEDVRGAAVIDSADRQVRFLRECVVSRPSLQAAITERGVKFGAVKFAASDDMTELLVDIDLRPDGSFVVARGRSRYFDNELVSEMEFGRRVVDDVAFSFIPRLEAAHLADRAWHGGGRTRFLRAVRAMFHGSTTP